MDQAVMDKLYENFVIDIKPGKGAFKYVRTRHILDRMNKAFKGNWGTHIVSHTIIDDEVLVLASVYIYNDDGHILAQQQGFGSAKKFNGVELGNIYKSATSKAIKSAVRNWGVALFLEEEEDTTASTGTYTAPARPNITMPAMGTPPPVTASTALGPNTGSGPSGYPGSVPNNVPNNMPSMPTNAPVVNNASPMVDNVPATPFDTPSMPTMPTELPTMVPTLGSVPSTDASKTQANITPVQKVAILSRLSAKGVVFEEICKEFYDKRPNSIFVDSLDNMTYNDALDLVSFLNSK